jgi:hypothetical protein
MTELRKNRYVERVREATRSLFEDLLEANRRLCLTLAMLNEDRTAKQQELGEFSERSARWQAQQQSLHELLEAADREFKAFQDQFAAVERQNSNLATLYAAGHVLHSSLERQAVLGAIQEIVINLVGSEQFAIVLADDKLTPQALFGVESRELEGLTPRAGIIGRANTEKRPFTLPRGSPTDTTGVRACVPLVADGETRGFVLIFDFLPQKGEISALDHELFTLIGSQAALALYAAELHAERGASGV